MSYQPLLLNFDEAAELRKELGKDSLLGNALTRDIKQTDAYMAEVGIEVPGHGEGGGYGRRQATNDASSGWHDYMREPGDDAAIPADQLEAINDLLARRLALKKTRKFEEADALQAELIDELGVGVDDRSRTWWVENVAD